MYAGPARNSYEAKCALNLATASFTRLGTDTTSNKDSKSFLLYQHPGFSENSTIVVCDGSGIVIASAFLIECKMPVSSGILNSFFISTVSVDEKFRGRGHSNLLMDAAIQKAINLGGDVAVVIARRAVDHYYTRFGFWGISQYSKAIVEISEAFHRGRQRSHLSVKPASISNLFECAFLFGETYKNLIGHCKRNNDAWLYIFEKVKYLGMRMSLLMENETVKAYAIHDWGGEVNELGLPIEGLTFDEIAVLLFSILPDTKSLTLNLPPAHPFFAMLEGLDFSITLRECPYGGHMVRVLNPKRVALLRSTVDRIDDASINPLLGFAETVAVMRVARLTDQGSALSFSSAESFNIPLLDQI
tara:strand:+ start:2801 stop:3877 length:1077 start_codon:yes stop_codon:yes gene_type:complete